MTFPTSKGHNFVLYFFFPIGVIFQINKFERKNAYKTRMKINIK